MLTRPALPPVVRLLLRVMAAVFAAEALVMFILARFMPPLGNWLETLVGSTLLTLLVAPPLWRRLVVSDRQRRRGEDELRASEDRYRAIVEDQNELICRWSFTDGITFINEAGCRYLSLPRSEILGRSFEPYVYEEDRPAVQAHFASLKPEASVGVIEHRVRLPTGEVRWTQWTDRAFFDAAGRLLEFQSVGRDVTKRKRAEAALRALSLQLSRAEGAERRRIARELHDSTGQKLAALSMTIGLLQDATGAPAGKSEKMLADCLAAIEQCAEEIRTLSYLLHPPLLEELGLVAAVRDYVEGFSQRSGVQVALAAPLHLERLPDEVEIALFRVVQECLGNIHRHAGASTAHIRFACGAEQVTLEVSDQGRGISAQAVRAIEAGRGSAGVGILGMRERLRLLGDGWKSSLAGKAPRYVPSFHGDRNRHIPERRSATAREPRATKP